MKSELLRGIGVIFDMDGVLVDSYAAHMRSWQLLGDELGRPVSEAEFAGTFGQTSRDIIRTLFGPGRSDEEVRTLDDRKESLYRDLIRDHVPLMPGAAEVLARIHGAGGRLAIGSSGPRENVQLVTAALASIQFDAVVSGADLSRGKPDPQVFLLATERLHLAPAACLVVEDAVVGVDAARRASMKVVGLNRTSDPNLLAAADLQIADLRYLIPEIVHNLLVQAG